MTAAQFHTEVSNLMGTAFADHVWSWTTKEIKAELIRCVCAGRAPVQARELVQRAYAAGL